MGAAPLQTLVGSAANGTACDVQTAGVLDPCVQMVQQLHNPEGMRHCSTEQAAANEDAEDYVADGLGAAGKHTIFTATWHNMSTLRVRHTPRLRVCCSFRV